MSRRTRSDFVKMLAEEYKNSKVYGVECAPYMLEAVGNLPSNAEIVESDLQNPQLPFENNSVDVAIKSIRRVTRRGRITTRRPIHRAIVGI